MTTGPTRASTWYRTAGEFQQVCLDAVSLAKGEAAEEFAHRMLEAANQYGLDTYISHPQLAWLCELADSVQPLERAR